MRTPSGRVDQQPVHTVAPAVKVSLGALVAGWTARKLWRLLVITICTPAALATLLAAVTLCVVWRRFGVWPILVVIVVLSGLLVGWRVRWPGGFLRFVRQPWRAWRRGWWVYRRRWVPAMDTAGLTAYRRRDEFTPSILRVSSTL